MPKNKNSEFSKQYKEQSWRKYFKDKKNKASGAKVKAGTKVKTGTKK